MIVYMVRMGEKLFLELDENNFPTLTYSIGAESTWNFYDTARSVADKYGGDVICMKIEEIPIDSINEKESIKSSMDVKTLAKEIEQSIQSMVEQVW